MSHLSHATSCSTLVGIPILLHLLDEDAALKMTNSMNMLMPSLFKMTE